MSKIKMVSIPKLITIVKLNHSASASLPLQQKCPSVNILYKNELLQIDQVEHDNDLSQKPFLSYSSILDRRKQFYRRF